MPERDHRWVAGPQLKPAHIGPVDPHPHRHLLLRKLSLQPILPGVISDYLAHVHLGMESALCILMRRIIMHNRGLLRLGLKAVKRFAYSLPSHPNMSFDVSIEQAHGTPVHFNVHMEATGSSAERGKWRRMFTAWSADAGCTLRFKSPDRRLERTGADVAVPGCPNLCAFLVHWVGWDWIESAVQTSEGRTLGVEVEMHILGAKISRMSAVIDRIASQVYLTDRKLRVALREIQDTDSGPVQVSDEKVACLKIQGSAQSRRHQ